MYLAFKATKTASYNVIFVAGSNVVASNFVSLRFVVKNIGQATVLQANAISAGNVLGDATLNMNSHTISNLLDPVNAQDAVTKAWVQANTITGSPAQIVNASVATSKLTANSTELTNGSTPLNMNSQKITNLATPTTAQDASTKAYVDSAIASIPSSIPNKIQSANITLDLSSDTYLSLKHASQLTRMLQYFPDTFQATENLLIK